MSFTLQGGAVTPSAFKLTGTSATTIFAPTYKSIVKILRCTEIAGATPTLTIDLYDGTTAYYLRNALAMTAKERVEIEDIIVPANWLLRVTAGTANQIDVLCDYFSNPATAR